MIDPLTEEELIQDFSDLPPEPGESEDDQGNIDPEPQG